MKGKNLSDSPEKREIYLQAKNSPIYWLLKNDTEELMSLPINTNSLQFRSKEINIKYFKELYIGKYDDKLSKEFKQNLIVFYVYFTITLFFIIGSIWSDHQIPVKVFKFHLSCCLFLLAYSYFILWLVVKTRYFLIRSREMFTIVNVLFITYTVLGHNKVLPSLLNCEDIGISLPYSLIIASFIYFYRTVIFDYYKYVVLTSVYASFLFLIVQTTLSSRPISEKFIEYLFLILFLTLISIESYKVGVRAALIFFRLHYEDIKNKPLESDNRPSNEELKSGSELVIEKCDQIINEVKHTKRLIIFKDVRDRLKFSIKSLESIKKYLGHSGMKDEFINISDSARIDDQDKQFLVQNFLENTQFLPVGQYTRNLTLKDLLMTQPRMSLSLRALQDSAMALERIGNDWNFDIFSLSKQAGGPVSIIAKHFFYKWDISKILNTELNIFFRFFENIEINYRNNPYHNSKHAGCVFNSFLCLIINSKLETLLNPLESVVSMVATLSHDIGHPGLTNRYLISSKNELALRYNDMSVLENMHCALIYTLLNDPLLNIFSALKQSEWTNSRKLLIEMILHTDMSKHFETLSRFRMRANSLKDLNEEILEDRTSILCMCLKCADLGHSAKVFELHEKWTELVCEEFFLQGDLEKLNFMPVSIYCDRDDTDVPKSQAGFIRNVCIPLYLVFFNYSRSEFVERECVEQLYKNLNIWEERSKQKVHSPLKVQD